MNPNLTHRTIGDAEVPVRGRERMSGDHVRSAPRGRNHAAPATQTAVPSRGKE